ncbi:MAG: FAD-linked oxidase C-terminal domain-containing protein, partial [Thermoplasmata archaeon]
IKAAIMGILCDRSTVALTPYILIDKKSRPTSVFAKKFGELAFTHGGRPTGSSMFSGSYLKRFYGEGINTILDIKSAIDPHDIMNPDRLR